MLQAFASGKLFGEVYGQGKPWVLALHGWGHTHEDFTATLLGVQGPPPSVAPSLAHVGHVDAIDAIGLDLAGFGAAPAPLEPWGLADYAGAVAPILSEMGDKVVILGHSFGGRVALRVAAANAERVTALVLSGVPFVLGPQGRVKPKVCYRATRLLWRAGLMSDVRMESARQRYGSRDYRNATGVMRAVLVRVLGESDGAVLSALNMPVELIWGADDTAASPDRARAAAALLSSATLEVLPGIDHFTPIHAPGALRAGILKHRP